MNTVCRDIFRAIHENKWLSIEYKNKQEDITKYWIGIIDVNPIKRILRVEGLHLGQYSTIELNIYIDCNRLDSVPYKAEYSLIDHFDGDCVQGKDYYLTLGQFQEIVSNFQYRSTNNAKNKRIKQIALNVLSVPMKQGLYVLAYREMRLDVIRKCLKPAEEILF